MSRKAHFKPSIRSQWVSVLYASVWTVEQERIPDLLIMLVNEACIAVAIDDYVPRLEIQHALHRYPRSMEPPATAVFTVCVKLNPCHRIVAPWLEELPRLGLQEWGLQLSIQDDLPGVAFVREIATRWPAQYMELVVQSLSASKSRVVWLRGVERFEVDTLNRIGYHLATVDAKAVIAPPDAWMYVFQHAAGYSLALMYELASRGRLACWMAFADARGDAACVADSEWRIYLRACANNHASLLAWFDHWIGAQYRLGRIPFRVTETVYASALRVAVRERADASVSYLLRTPVRVSLMEEIQALLETCDPVAYSTTYQLLRNHFDKR